MIIVVTVNYFPGYTIRALAYGELATSTIILVVHWVYILFKLRKKVKQLKKEERCSSKLLYNFPVCSVREILPRNVFSSQVNFKKARYTSVNSFIFFQPFLDREVVRIALSFLEMVQQITCKNLFFLVQLNCFFLTGRQQATS